MRMHARVRMLRHEADVCRWPYHSHCDCAGEGQGLTHQLTNTHTHTCISPCHSTVAVKAPPGPHRLVLGDTHRLLPAHTAWCLVTHTACCLPMQGE